MDVLRAANAHEATGAEVVHMEVGEPGVPAPKAVREAASRALEAGKIGYTEALGIPPLRNAIAESYSTLYGIDVAPERVLVTTGSSAGFNLTFLAAFDPGDRIAIPTPGYPCYRNIMRAFGLEPVEIETGPETRWALTPELLATAHAEAPLAGVLVASPANPSGTVIPPDALATLIRAAEDMGLWFISDEIYHRLTYGEPAATALATSDRAIIINSFSKYYCMTGWRIGWMVAPEALLRPMERLAQNLYISAPTLSQHAALAALEATEDLEAVKAVYAKNRAYLLEHLPRIGLGEFLPADGAFYVYADVRRFTNDSTDFARRMLLEANVAVTPGADFDLDRGSQFIRLSFAGSHDDIVEAVRRLEGWLR
ncbi:MAG: aminotransferase class I/II-fold pyridoxal phosphate-dependent enzyme [Hyphomicrobiales bacterium]|nr:aminotransferase class I/II-fold pyridoxal phosphate-dependent enzyme [Hyphomicrobiales bacterium]